MSILTHDEAKRLSQSSTDPLEVIRNVEAAVIVKLAVSQNALKDEIRLIWKPKCDALRQQLEAAQAEVKHLNLHLKATQSGRDAALARLAEIEAHHKEVLSDLDIRINYAESRKPTLEQFESWWRSSKYMQVVFSKQNTRQVALDGWNAAAGASPVEPSQTQPVFVSESLGHLTASGVPKTIDQFQLALNAAFAAGKVVGASPQPKMVTPYITQEHFDKAFPVNVPPSQALSLDLLERLSKTLTRLGYATPEGGMEHFNADLTNQLYNLCRAVDSLFDREQPPAPSEAAREYMTGYSEGREWAGATSQAQPSQAGELSDKNEPPFAWWCESSDCITRSSHVLNNWITKGIKAIPLYK